MNERMRYQISIVPDRDHLLNLQHFKIPTGKRSLHEGYPSLQGFDDFDLLEGEVTDEAVDLDVDGGEVAGLFVEVKHAVDRMYDRFGYWHR